MATYRVEGMSCGGCENAVKRVVGAVAPDAVVEADHSADQVSVTGTHDDAALQAALEKAGYAFLGLAD